MAKRVSCSNFSLGELFQTTDGGVTWRQLTAPIGDDIRFVSPTDGWIAGGASGNQFYVTRDGGKSWQEQRISLPSEFADSLPTYQLPEFPQGNQDGVLPVTFTGTKSGIGFYVTRDGGKSWTFASGLHLNQELNAGVRISADAVDLNAWVAASLNGGSIFKTLNKGGNWQDLSTAGLPVVSNVSVTHLKFATVDAGWSIVRAGACVNFKKDCTFTNQLFRTVNGGASWERLNP